MEKQGSYNQEDIDLVLKIKNHFDLVALGATHDGGGKILRSFPDDLGLFFKKFVEPSIEFASFEDSFNKGDISRYELGKKTIDLMFDTLKNMHSEIYEKNKTATK